MVLVDNVVADLQILDDKAAALFLWLLRLFLFGLHIEDVRVHENAAVDRKGAGKSIILSQKHDLLIRIGIGKLLHLMILQAVLIEKIFQQGERFLLAVVKDQRVAVTHILLNVAMNRFTG